MNKRMSKNNYVTMFGWMFSELGLAPAEALIFSLIYSFSRDGMSRYCGGRNYIAQTFNLSVRQVDRILKKLVTTNLIEKIKVSDKPAMYHYRALVDEEGELLTEPVKNNNKNVAPRDNMSQGSDKMSLGSDKMSLGGSDNMSHYINNNNINNNNININKYISCPTEDQLDDTPDTSFVDKTVDNQPPEEEIPARIRNFIPFVDNVDNSKTATPTEEQAEETPEDDTERILNRNINQIPEDQLTDFERIYKEYPRHEGRVKGEYYYNKYLKGWKHPKYGHIKLSNWAMWEAVHNYKVAIELEGRQLKYVKQFSAFMYDGIFDYLPERDLLTGHPENQQ